MRQPDLNDTCNACCLFWCDPLSPLCLQSPEGKLAAIRGIKSAEAKETAERHAAHCAMMRSHIDPEAQAANARRQLARVNAKRASGFDKYRQRARAMITNG